MSNNTPLPDGRWRRFGRGMLVSLLIVVAWSALCWNLRGNTGPYWLELRQFGIFNLYVLAMLAQMALCLLLARRKSWWWSVDAIGGTLLGAACPVALALIAASGIPAMQY